MSDLRYVGDISREDAGLLAAYARGARSILEFGAGGSTQVMAQSRLGGSSLTCIETDHSWLEVTRSRVERLGAARGVTFQPYEGWQPSGSFDLVFDDGADHLLDR